MPLDERKSGREHERRRLGRARYRPSICMPPPAPACLLAVPSPPLRRGPHLHHALTHGVGSALEPGHAARKTAVCGHGGLFPPPEPRRGLSLPLRGPTVQHRGEPRDRVACLTAAKLAPPRACFSYITRNSTSGRGLAPPLVVAGPHPPPSRRRRRSSSWTANVSWVSQHRGPGSTAAGFPG